jgi:hypothetical protein
MLALWLALAIDAHADAIGSIKAEAIRADIGFLADDRFAGRYCRSPQAFEAARWIASQFADAGLEHVAGGDEFFHGVSDDTMAPNVIGMRPGRSESVILITAHYDHLKPIDAGDAQVRVVDGKPDTIFNGADDNASGTAGMLAIARATGDLELESTLIFIAFTGEEVGLRGARHVAGKPPFEMDRVRAMFNLDMISRGEPDVIFVDGPAYAQPLKDAMTRANDRFGIGLRIRFDQYPEWLMRSDQAPFLFRKVPAVLLSVEDHEDYHQVTDHAERALPELAERVSRLVLGAVIEMEGR